MKIIINFKNNNFMIHKIYKLFKMKNPKVFFNFNYIIIFFFFLIFLRNFKGKNKKFKLLLLNYNNFIILSFKIKKIFYKNKFNIKVFIEDDYSEN